MQNRFITDNTVALAIIAAGTIVSVVALFTLDSQERNVVLTAVFGTSIGAAAGITKGTTNAGDGDGTGYYDYRKRDQDSAPYIDREHEP